MLDSNGATPVRESRFLFLETTGDLRSFEFERVGLRLRVPRFPLRVVGYAR